MSHEDATGFLAPIPVAGLMRPVRVAANPVALDLDPASARTTHIPLVLRNANTFCQLVFAFTTKRPIWLFALVVTLLTPVRDLAQNAYLVDQPNNQVLVMSTSTNT